MYVCMYVNQCVPGALGGKERVSDHLELELSMVIVHLVRAENCY